MSILQSICQSQCLNLQAERSLMLEGATQVENRCDSNACWMVSLRRDVSKREKELQRDRGFQMEVM